MLSLKQIEDNGVQGIIVPDNVADARLMLAHVCYYHANVKPLDVSIAKVATLLNEMYPDLIMAAGEGELNRKSVARFIADWVYRMQPAWETQNRVARINRLLEIDELMGTYFEGAKTKRADVLPYLQLLDREMALRDMEATKRVEVTKGELTPEAKNRATELAKWLKEYQQQQLLGDGDSGS